MRSLIITFAVIITAGCYAPASLPSSPPPVATVSIGIVVEAPDLSRIAGASVTLQASKANSVPHTQTTGPDGLTVFTLVASTGKADVWLSAPGYLDRVDHLAVIDHQNYFFILDADFPAPPSRDTMGHVRFSDMQGLTVHTDQFGDLPWWGAALFSLTPADRLQVYAAKHAQGDTHAILTFEAGSGSLYDEPGNPYQQMRVAGFQGRPGALADAVREVVQHGFYPLIFLAGDDGSTCEQVPTPAACGYVVARAQLPILIHELQTPSVDLTRFACIIPGWDGVFYGWTPGQITEFGVYFRTLLPDGCLGIEHSTGHIPVGNGPADWISGGPMRAYDLILSEFNGWLPGDVPGDQVWQVSARLLGPLYRRGPDQPVDDDPTPPWYLRDGTPRGPYFVCDFEFETYAFVRGLPASVVDQERSYFEARGWPRCG